MTEIEKRSKFLDKIIWELDDARNMLDIDIESIDNRELKSIIERQQIDIAREYNTTVFSLRELLSLDKEGFFSGLISAIGKFFESIINLIKSIFSFWSSDSSKSSDERNKKVLKRNIDTLTILINGEKVKATKKVVREEAKRRYSELKLPDKKEALFQELNSLLTEVEKQAKKDKEFEEAMKEIPFDHFDGIFLYMHSKNIISKHFGYNKDFRTLFDTQRDVVTMIEKMFYENIFHFKPFKQGMLKVNPDDTMIKKLKTLFGNVDTDNYIINIGQTKNNEVYRALVLCIVVTGEQIINLESLKYNDKELDKKLDAVASRSRKLSQLKDSMELMNASITSLDFDVNNSIKLIKEFERSIEHLNKRLENASEEEIKNFYLQYEFIKTMNGVGDTFKSDAITKFYLGNLKVAGLTLANMAKEYSNMMKFRDKYYRTWNLWLDKLISNLNNDNNS